MAFLLGFHALLLAWGAWRHSPTFNEPAHLVAGISNWQFGRFELYRVNPPLVRMVAALPVLAAGAETDWHRFYEKPGARPIFHMGQDFVAANGERSLWLVTIARWACIPFSLLGGYVCFRWACEILGYVCGLLALTLWCFSPNIMAHGQLITPDCAAAAMGVTAAYFFWHWLKSPTWGRALSAGFVLGLTELTKMTWIILFVLYPLLWLCYRSSERSERSGGGSCKQAVQLAVVLSVALYVLNLGYGFRGTFTKLGDYEFVSKTLKDPGIPRYESGNRFVDSWLGVIPVPVPRNYLLGLDLQRRDFESFGRPSYLRGQFCDRGWWYYYLYAAAIKAPLGTWLLAILALICRPARSALCTRRDYAALLLPPLAVLVLTSSQTAFSHHFRYALPAFPFAFIAISRVGLTMTLLRNKMKIVILVLAALAWSVGSSLCIYPHSLSYFNELVGGPRHGHMHLINSNIDWGQDLLYLRRWLEEHPEARPLSLAYYGSFDPLHIGIDYKLPPGVSAEREDESEFPPLQPGWYAVSVNFLKGYGRRIPDGNGKWALAARGVFVDFQRLQPTALAGYSIYVYHVTAEHTPRVQQGFRTPGN